MTGHHSMMILASGSPRRKEILERHGIDPVIIKPEVDESVPSGFSIGLSPEQTVMYLALKKALAVYNYLDDNRLKKSDHLLSADTIVYDGRIIGKPSDLEEAFAILKSLKNKRHFVITGMALMGIKNKSTQIFYDTSEVYFKNYSDQTIEEYIKKDSPLDKAGSYAIQSEWKSQVEKIEGDVENIIGLPWHLIANILRHQNNLAT